MRRPFRIALVATLLLVGTLYTILLPWGLAWEYRLNAVTDPAYLVVLAPSLALAWSYFRALRRTGAQTQIVGRAALAATVYVVWLAGKPVFMDVVYAWLVAAFVLLAVAERLKPPLLLAAGSAALALLSAWMVLAPPDPRVGPTAGIQSQAPPSTR